MDFEKLLKALIPDPRDCVEKAAQLRKAYPKFTDQELANKAVRQAKTMLAVAGAGSGLVTNPLAMVPLAATEMGVVLNREARLAGVVAALLEPSVLQDDDAFAADVLAILFPGAVSQALSQFTVRAGQQTSKVLIRKYVSKDVLKRIITFAAKYLGIKLTQRAIITKAIPLVGAVIGGTWNWLEVQALGKRAINYYAGEAIAEPPKAGPAE
jgi:uncharacterized protein (DUF697 family)